MSEPGPSSRNRQRLNREASAFLTNYASTINAYPQWSEKQNILAKIQAIPGNGWYTIERLNTWFVRHRHPTSARRQSLGTPSAAGPVLVDEETILFPKLTPVHLQQLRILYKKRTDPAENIVTFWAERIKADRHEVVAWIRYQQENAKESDCHQTSPESPDIPLRELVGDPDGSEGCASPTAPAFPHTHLPTPAKSQSPSISPHVRMPSLPPIAVKIEPEPRQCLSPPISAHSPTSTSYQLRTDARLLRDSSQSFATIVRESLRHNSPTEPPPKTPDEFAAKFVTFEKMIDAFMDQHTSGRLARLGWDPSQPTPSSSGPI